MPSKNNPNLSTAPRPTPSSTPSRGRRGAQRAGPSSRANRKDNPTHRNPNPRHPQVCHRFANTGACPFGERCRFSHNPRGTPQHSSSLPAPSAQSKGSQDAVKLTTHRNPNHRHPPICHPFANTGACPFGERCRFSHDLRSTTQHSSSPPAFAQPQASQDVVEFITHLDRNIRRPKFTLHLEDPETKELWLKSWAAVAVGATITSAEALLRVYMRLPASTAIAPHPHHVLQTLSSVVNHSVANGKRSKAALIHVLQLVADIIEHRLLPNQTPIPDHLRADCVTAIDHLRKITHESLISVITDPHHAERASRLLSRFLGLLHRCSRHFETANASNAEQQPTSHHPAWAGWRNATVDWLQRGSWLDIPQLQAQYDDVASYTQSLREFVTMLTFYWGAGAVFPKCRHRGHDDRPCDEPLCAVFSGDRRRPCGRRFSSGNVCSAPAKWRCSRKGHDVACDRCLRQMQTAVVGKPGSRASTDIYDAVVGRETVRRGGLVYVLSQLASRKPPKIAPNWRTTYRLKCSALVGVVRLGASCEPLEAHQRLELAEIVPVHPTTGNTTDFEERQRGRLALRLLTRGDISSLSPGGETLEHGVRVAIIDMQVFVPEVLSVLSTLSDVEFPGHLNAIPFSDALIGSTPPEHDSVQGDNSAAVLISNALANTEIDLIRRLPPSAQNALCLDLVEMAQRIALDGTQLKAFAAALEKTLHCTQGPPGTGKSYLGVALILALDLVRTYVLKAGIAVGPIVVLSYKNHALDEILMDFVKSDGRRNWHPGTLIRCGKPEDERLNLFRERNWPEETAARDVLSSRVSCMRWINRTLRDWRSLRTVFLASAEDENGIRMLQDWAPSRSGKNTDVTEFTQKWMLQAVRANLMVGEVVNETTSESAYEAIEKLSAVWDRVEETIPFEGPSPYSGLEAEMEHWAHTGPSRKAFLLGKWLFGATPPPRCAANEEEGRCLMRSPAPGSYCKEFHACLSKTGCNRRRTEDAQLCGTHRCIYENQEGGQCQRARLQRSDVCDWHGCPRCIATKAPRVQPKEFGANACPRHKCKAPTCDDAQLGDQFPYCMRHGCRLCRMKLVENRHSEIRSVSRLQGSQFCKEHKCEVHNCVRYRLSESESDQDFCVVHACITCDGKRNRVSATCPRSRLCDLHRCCQTDAQKKPCPERRENNSMFCESHTCRVCHEKGLPLDRNVIDHPPRNVCVLHPLCSFVFPDGAQCNRLTGGKGQQYCERHVFRDSRRESASPEGRVVEMKCHGVTTKGRPCKAVVKLPADSKYYYCAPHISQMPASSSSESDDGSDHGESVSSNEEDQGEEEFFDTRDAPLLEANPLRSFPVIEPELLSPRSEDRKDSEGNPDDTTMSQDVKDRDLVKAKNESYAKIGQGAAHHDSGMSRSETPTTAFTPEKSQIEYDGNQSDNSEKSELVDNRATSTRIDGQQDEMVDSLSDATSSAADADNVNERVLFGTNPDECDIPISDGELSDDDVPDHLQHLHDIIDNESMSGSESDDEQLIDVPEDDDEGDHFIMHSHDPREWNWGQTPAERCRRAAELLRHVCGTWMRLSTIADAHVERARRERAEAAGFVYKKARLIGATVVGATRRLQAIRASEPFAMIVEEACEVLEPTLVAVLAVRSLRKLELIGDHRQLPAFVQPCWFSIQMTHPSMKVSLFERLVNNFSLGDGCEGVSTCSVLDIQRRMRPEICDLTRCEYDDLIHILDDPCTIARRIGEGNNTKSLNTERELWSSQGRKVPGIQSQVFFWNLKTKEGRAAVGLSRCNNDEAEACAKLVGWFIHCGIPATSISVITPYKGQKLTIVRALRKVRGALRYKAKEYSREVENGVIVSTVDRYQGDENDIVILSLVCTRPGNRFIALRNRFIVASSRARLGFIIIGCTDALTKSAHGGDGPSHWRRFLQDLTQTEYHKADQDRNVELKRVRRITDKLPICCPRHPETMLEVSESSEFPHLSEEKLAEFCSKTCPYLLPWCGHSCKVPCHKPTIVPHTSKCDEIVQRPCSVHESVALNCHSVKGVRGASTESLNEALEAYDCEIMTGWLRPECFHAVQVPCHEQKKLLEGTLELPECTERVTDYVNPLCGHIITAPYCHTRRKWEGNPPKCRVIVTYDRPCGCRARMACHQRVYETSLDAPPLCKEAVSRSRPRCSHSLSSRCHEATALREIWIEQEGEAITSTPPLVIHGIEYGPSETQLSLEYPDRLQRELPRCLVLTHYKSSCGHVITVPCSEAFEIAAGQRKESLCMQDKDFRSPLCGHRIMGPCYTSSLESKRHAALVSVIAADTQEKAFRSTVHEGALQTAPPLDGQAKKISKLCASTVNAIRTCGHITESIPCRRLFSIFRSKKLPPCKASVGLKRPCGHAFDALCHRREEEPPICEEAVDDEYSYPCGRPGHAVQPGTCSELTTLRGVVNQKCPIEVQCIRARCKHVVSVPCFLEKNVTAILPGTCLESEAECAIVHAGVDYRESEAHVAGCTEPVVYQRQCGHKEVGVQCKIAFEWTFMPDEAPQCNHQVEITSPLCGHLLKVLCHQESSFHIDLWEGVTAERLTMKCDEYPVTSPIVEENRSKPSHPPESIIPFLKCGLTTRLVRSCGHEEDVPCESIFERIQSNCGKIDSEECTDCGFLVDVPCAKRKESTAPTLCENIVEKSCSLCAKNTVRVECYKQVSYCQREVRSALPCGHVVTWICGEDDPISGSDTEACLRCMKDKWAMALSQARETRGDNSGIEKTGPSNGEHLEANALGSRLALLPERFKNRVIQSIPSSCIQSRAMLTVFDTNNLWAAYLDILSCNVDLLSNIMANSADGGIELTPPPDVFDVNQSYDLVYCVLSERSNPEESFKHTDTVYGFGAEAKVLSMGSLRLECQKSGHTGSLSICIAGALRYRTLTDTDPFRTHTRTGKRKSKNAVRDEAKARRLMQAYKRAGFDNVAFNNEKRGHERVYWIPGAVIPLMKLDLQLFRTCGICRDSMLPSKGWVCPQMHFVCHSCFIMCIESALQPDCGTRIVDSYGNLLCPYERCAVKYDELSLLRQPHGESENEIQTLFEGLQKLKMAAHAKQEVSAALDVQKRQLQADFQRVMQIKDHDERRAETLRIEIIDQILTLRCPVKRCRMAFVDFEGCFDLTCSGCHVHFCAWCIRHCSPTDVHSHVRECPERSGNGLFHDQRVFEAHQRRRRKQLVLQRLRKETADVRKRALKSLHCDLRDLNIEIHPSEIVSDTFQLPFGLCW